MKAVEQNEKQSSSITEMSKDEIKEHFSPFSEVETIGTKRSVERVEKININARMVIAYDQDSTMYLETGNACASGNYPYVGCVAVHRKSSTDRTPIIPFGSRIYYEDDSVNINGGNYSSFIVEDNFMKKIIYILVILLGFLVCTGCEKNTYNKGRLCMDQITQVKT